MKLYNLNGTEKATVVENKDFEIFSVYPGLLLNKWEVNGAYPFMFKYNNFVLLFMLVRNGTPGIIFNIPQSFRPKTSNVAVASCDYNKTFTIVINSNGNVELIGEYTSGNVFLQTSWLTN